MYSSTVPSSFSSTMCASKTLSYKVCGGLTAEGMAVAVVLQIRDSETRGVGGSGVGVRGPIAAS